MFPLIAAATFLGAALVAGFTDHDALWAAVSPSCQVKGNISQGGERIYHVPGQRYYHEARVKLFRGERWFCSTADAERAGWRRARI